MASLNYDGPSAAWDYEKVDKAAKESKSAEEQAAEYAKRIARKPDETPSEHAARLLEEIKKLKGDTSEDK